MYQRIRQHPGVRKIYADKLIGDRVITAEEAERMVAAYVASLEQNEPVAGPLVCDIQQESRIDFSPFHGTHWREPCETAISLDRVRSLTQRFIDAPEGFRLHRSVSHILEQRRNMGQGKLPIDWGYAETLAYASLLDEGHPVRLSGQDSERGTFFHRHAVLHDQPSGDTYLPLQHLREGQAPFLVINSILSEEAVLGFEYGYSSSAPQSLVIWEAQFGDFANGAQVVIDQFISSCEAAEENMQVCIPSTPAQMFHLLRRQVLRRYRKPLVVFTPKSLLRHKLSTSPLDDLTEGSFQVVIDEIDPIDPKLVEHLIVCSGKVYFDLLEARRANRIEDVAIVRIEQLYPFPVEEVDAILARYPNATDVVWVQEEPRNQGAWVYLLARLHLFGRLHEPQQLRLVARPYSASPAVGYMSKHLEQQQALVDEALKLPRAAAVQKKTA
jgi:2-oxoglutarate dehydrogenase E1 component